MKRINLYIFARRPEISVGKSRLKKKIGKITGSNLYLNNLLKTLKIFYRDKRFNLKICVFPDNASKFWSKSVFPKINRVPQGKGDLGEKMWTILSKDRKCKIIIGSDIIGIKVKYIIEAWKKLKNNDIVLGPAEDGGFWLIGIANKKKLKFIFNNVNWDIDNTLAQLKYNLTKNNISIGYIETLKDID